MNEIKLARQRLADAVGLPAVLAAGWEIFELIAVIAALSADEASGMYPAFTFARGAAVSGRDAIAFAPSTPPTAGDPVPSPPEPARDVYETADALAGLASALRMRLRESAELAVDTADRAACERAATDAERITGLLAKGN